MAKNTPQQLAKMVDSLLEAYRSGGKEAASARYLELAKGIKTFEAMILRNTFQERLAYEEADK